MSTSVLRRMRWWDVAAVARLERELFPYDAWSEEMFWSELGQSDTRHYVVSETAAAIVGYAGLMAVGDTADVQTVAVAASEQGRGTGRLLLRELLAEADRRACSTVMLEVRADATVAQRLYESEGFVRLAQRRGYYPDGSDALVLRRRASAPAAAAGGHR